MLQISFWHEDKHRELLDIHMKVDPLSSARKRNIARVARVDAAAQPGRVCGQELQNTHHSFKPRSH